MGAENEGIDIAGGHSFDLPFEIVRLQSGFTFLTIFILLDYFLLTYVYTCVVFGPGKGDAKYPKNKTKHGAQEK